MALGKPAVLTPKALDLRAVQGTVAAIRERLQFIEHALATANSPSATQTNEISTLQFQLAQINSRLTVVEGQIGVTDVVNLTADAAVAAGDPVFATGVTSCSPVLTSDPTAIYAMIGVAQTAAAVGQSVPVQRRGKFALVGTAFEAGRAVYVTAGGYTQAPSYDDVALPIGVAVSSTVLWIAPGAPSLRTMDFDPFYEDFMPASVGLVRDAILLLESFNAQPDGFVVKIGENLVGTRALIAGSGSGLTITDEDGVLGDPVFEVHPGE